MLTDAFPVTDPSVASVIVAVTGKGKEGFAEDVSEPEYVPETEPARLAVQLPASVVFPVSVYVPDMDFPSLANLPVAAMLPMECDWLSVMLIVRLT